MRYTLPGSPSVVRWALACAFGVAIGCGTSLTSSNDGPDAGPFVPEDASARDAESGAVAVDAEVSDPFAGKKRFGIASGGLVQWDTDAELKRELDDVQSLGATWIRFNIDWADIQHEKDGPLEFARYDRVVNEARARGLRVLGIFLFTPCWASAAPKNDAGGCSEFAYPPLDNGAFAVFVKAAVTHFRLLGVSAWEVWNEPNVKYFWKPTPNAEAFAAMLRAAYQAIHEADPDATVVSGGLSPAVTEDGGNIAPKEYLAQLYADAGIQGHFDALGYHPYDYPSTPDGTEAWNAWRHMVEPGGIRDQMMAHGDEAKKIWATEFGVPTYPADGGRPDGSVLMSEGEQAAIVTRAYDLFSSYAWAGPLFWYSYQDTGADLSNLEHWFGLVRKDGSHKPAFAAYQSRAHDAGR